MRAHRNCQAVFAREGIILCGLDAGSADAGSETLRGAAVEAERAGDLLPERLDTDTAQYVWSLYRELGIEAMKESADWVSIYQQRPIQPVQ